MMGKTAPFGLHRGPAAAAFNSSPPRSSRAALPPSAAGAVPPSRALAAGRAYRRCQKTREHPKDGENRAASR